LPSGLTGETENPARTSGSFGKNIREFLKKHQGVLGKTSGSFWENIREFWRENPDFNF